MIAGVAMRLCFSRHATLILSGLLMAGGGAYAQEAEQGTRQRAELAVHKTDNAETYEKLLRQAGELMKNGEATKAYAILEPVEFDYSGNERFDYLIGIAALDSGKPDKATLAFERVLDVNPNNAAARLDMARAYYHLGDYQRARTEFVAVLQQNPSSAARANIENYLDRIDAQEEGKTTRFSGYMEGAAGRDNNINISTSQQQIFVDTLGTVLLSPSNVQMADNYLALAAGGEVNYEASPNWRLFGGGDVHKRDNAAHSDFNILNTDLRAGAIFDTRDDWIRLSALRGRYDLGGQHNSDAMGFRGEWRHAYSPADQLNAFAQSIKYRYVDVLMQPNDFDQRALGLGWQHVLAGGNSSLYGRVHLGTEKDVSSSTLASPDGGRNDGPSQFRGVRVGSQSSISETTFFLNAGVQTADYSKTNQYFQRKREDRFTDIVAGASWRWDKLWALRPQLNYSRNNSNIEIYSYNRTDISLTIHRDFR